jgi:hypothetical protein
MTFRCSQTGSNLEFWLSEPPTDCADSLEAVACPAGGHPHVVDKSTDRTLSDQRRREKEE